MCLFTSDKKALRAKKDIICYKSVAVGEYDCIDTLNWFRVTSIFKRFKYEGGVTYYENRFNKKANCLVISYGFHSYTKEKSARNDCFMTGITAQLILKCKVPRGAFYYRGNLSDADTESDYAEICSDMLQVLAWKNPCESENWHYATVKRGGILKAKFKRARHSISNFFLKHIVTY